MNIELVNSLPKDSRITLRRAFGKKITDVGLKEILAFYSIYPSGESSTRDEQNAFFATTLYCFNQDNNKKAVPFTKAVCTLYKKSSDSGKENIEHLINASYDISGTFFKKMYSMIKKMDSNGIYVDPQDMYNTLKYWDSNKTRKIKEIAKLLANDK